MQRYTPSLDLQSDFVVTISRSTVDRVEPKGLYLDVTYAPLWQVRPGLDVVERFVDLPGMPVHMFSGVRDQVGRASKHLAREHRSVRMVRYARLTSTAAPCLTGNYPRAQKHSA